MTVKLLNFTCPECGEHVISLTQNVSEDVAVDAVDTKYVSLELGSVIDGYINEQYEYKCHTCGFIIGNDEKEVAQWLIDRGMIDD